MGWFGAPLAQALKAHHQVLGTKTSASGVAAMRQEGIEAYQLGLNPKWEASPETAKALSEVDALVVNIPPGMRSGNSGADYAEKIKSLLAHLDKGHTHRLVFVSSTGVFGTEQGEVDEDTSPIPTRGAGEVLRAAEEFCLAQFSGTTAVIRPGGLVGGDRQPARFLAGRTGISGQHHPVNLVHRDDLVALTIAVLFDQSSRTIFHAVAAERPSKSEFYTAAARKLGLDAPHFDPSDMSTGKAILAEKSKNTLGITFQYDNPFDML